MLLGNDRPMKVWPHDVWPTEGGGHTYCGFHELKKPRFGSKDVVCPDIPDNYVLIHKDTRKEIEEIFKKQGYRIVTD